MPAAVPVPKVSVVIPALNAEKTIEACISSLRCQTLSPAEIILADSGSTDSTVELAKRAGAKIVRPKKTANRSAARNAGWRRARHSTIAFCDADTVFTRRWLELTAKKLSARSGFDAVADRRAVHKPKTFYLRLLQANYDLNYHNYQPFCAWVLKRRALEKTNGFNEELNVAEERDLGRRLLAQGFSIGFEPRAVQFHAGKPRTFSEGISRAFRHAAGRISYYRTRPAEFPAARLAFFLAIPASGIFALFEPVGLFVFVLMLAAAFLLALFNHAIRRNGISVLGARRAHCLPALAALSVADNLAFAFGTVCGALKGGQC